METYLTKSIAELKNMLEYDTMLQDLWKSPYFWKQLISEHALGEGYSMDKQESELKTIRISVNKRSIGNVYITQADSHSDIVNYIIPLIEHKLHIKNVADAIEKIKIQGTLWPWASSDKVSISVAIAEDVLPNKNKDKNVVTLPRLDLTEEEFMERVQRKFEIDALPQGFATWADLYEFLVVCSKPRKEIEVGARVDAWLDIEGESLVENYGYVIQTRCNTKNRPVRLVVHNMENHEEEVWVWHGSGAKARWIRESEMVDKVKVGNLMYKGLGVNQEVYKPFL